MLAAVLETLDSVDEYRNFFNWTWALYGLLLLSVWKDVLLWPKEALYGENLIQRAAFGIRLSGVYPVASSNDVATFSSILAVLCLARLFPASEEEHYDKLWYTLLFLVSMISLVMSQTRAALRGLDAGRILHPAVFQARKAGRVIYPRCCPRRGALHHGRLDLVVTWRAAKAPQQMDTLSNRTEWWGLAWQTFLQRPLTGFGAYAAGRFAVLAKAGFGGTWDHAQRLPGSDRRHGHLGPDPSDRGCWLGTWWLILRYVRDSPDPQERQLAHEGLAILALLTLRSFFNNMMTIHPALPFLAILGYAEFLRRRRKAANRGIRRVIPWPGQRAEGICYLNPFLIRRIGDEYDGDHLLC